jgi:hypothetical protein
MIEIQVTSQSPVIKKTVHILVQIVLQWPQLQYNLLINVCLINNKTTVLWEILTLNAHELLKLL